MVKSLDEAEAAIKKVSEKEKRMQEEAMPKEEKDKAIVKLEENDLTHADIAKKLEEAEAVLSRAIKKRSEKQRTIQEREKLLREK